MPLKSFIAVALILAALVTPAGAAGSDMQADADRWRAVVGGLEAAAFVSVRLKDGSTQKGTVLDVGDDSFGFQPRTRIPVAPGRIRYEDLAGLERAKQGMNPGQKVLASAAGVVGGTFLMMLLVLASAYD
ncbi:MAG: hypothetical protein U0Q55_02135 [Vicinamibacterales bacterium]